MNNLIVQNPPDLNAIQQAAGLNGTLGASTTIGQILAKLTPYIFAGAGMLLLIYLILGGIQLMTSQGEPKAAAAARQHITNALIGFVIIFFAFWAVQLAGLILNLPGITNIFGK